MLYTKKRSTQPQRPRVFRKLKPTTAPPPQLQIDTTKYEESGAVVAAWGHTMSPLSPPPEIGAAEQSSLLVASTEPVIQALELHEPVNCERGSADADGLIWTLLNFNREFCLLSADREGYTSNKRGVTLPGRTSKERAWEYLAAELKTGRGLVKTV